MLFFFCLYLYESNLKGIQMKNILAENMLRFGVKNLSKSDVKKINESSLLTEGFKGQDGITYALNFKDQAAFDKYYTEFPQTVGATPPWVSGIPEANRAAAGANGAVNDLI